MASLICDVGRTRLSFADTRAACRVSKSGFGLGVVECTAIGHLRDGQLVETVCPDGYPRDRCKPVNRRKVCDEIC